MLVGIINGLFQLYTLAIVVYCLMSWFPGALQTKFGMFLDRIVSPFLTLNYPIKSRKRKKSPCSTNSNTTNAMIGEKSMLKIGGIKWKRFKNGLTIRSKNIPNFVCKAPGNHDIKQYTTIANV